MLLVENIILAINGLLSNKMRALLTMLGIIIGIGSVIAIMTVGDSLTLTVSQNMQELGANDVYIVVQPKGSEEELSKLVDGVRYGTIEKNEEMTLSDEISEEMINTLCEKFKDEIYAISVSYTVGSGTAKFNDREANVSVLANSVGYYFSNKLEMIAGTMFSEEDFNERRKVTIVSDKVVNKLFDGDSRRALGNEIIMEVNSISIPFTIVGIYEYQDTSGMSMMMSEDAMPTSMFVPLKTGMDLNHEDYVYPYIQIISKVGVDSDELCSKAETFFNQYYKSNINFEVKAFTLGSMISMLTSTMSTITLAISIVAGIALIVGGIGVMNIMLVSITERTREIGTRKALGAKNSSIRTQFIVEAMIICLIGGAIGVALGVTGGMIAANALGAPASPSIKSILISLLFSMAIGVFFGFYPANKAAKMNPIDALRYE